MLTSQQSIEIAACLAEYYPIGKVHALAAQTFPVLDPTLTPEGSSVWLVDAEHGVFCLKRHRTGKPLSRIQFEQDLQVRMSNAARDMVPEPLKTIGGCSHFSIGEDWFRLERYINSQHHCWWRQDWLPEHCRAAGAALRQFHTLTARFLKETPDWLPLSGITCGANHGAYVSGFGPLGESIVSSFTAALVQAQAQAAVGSGQEHERVRENADSCALLIESTKQILAGAFEPRNSAQMVLVHGDYHPGNTLFVGKELKGIVDFEHVHLEDPGFDLGYAVLMFCTEWSKSAASVSGFDRDCLRALLDGYGLTDNAERTLPRQIIIACLLTGGWLLARSPLWRGQTHAIHCLEHVIGAWRRSLEELGG